MNNLNYKVSISDFCRDMWESDQPLTAFASQIGTSGRRIHAILANQKHVRIDQANKVSSYAAGFTLPHNPDQETIEIERAYSYKTTNMSDVKLLIRSLNRRFNHAPSNDYNQLFTLKWQLLFAHVRAGVFLTDTDEKIYYATRAAEFGLELDKLFDETNFVDPALMNIVKLRNVATTDFLAVQARTGNIPPKDDLLRHIAAYDRAEHQVKETLISEAQRLPIYRSLVLDQIEIAAYINDPNLIDSYIRKLEVIYESKSLMVTQLALESIPSAAKDVLWQRPLWKELHKKLNKAIAERAGDRSEA